MEIKDLPEELQITPLTDREKYCYAVGMYIGTYVSVMAILKYGSEHLDMERGIEISLKKLTELKNKLFPNGNGEYNYPIK